VRPRQRHRQCSIPPPPANEDASTLDTLNVTGYRYSIEQSLDQKRDASSIVEVITAEDISKFPDRNVADALQRVPGVIITRDAGGEGKTVSIRGLASDLTMTQLNGNYVASSETNDSPSRSFNYVLIPSNMISGVELFKTPEARIDEGGIGGTVILHTRRPLDIEANTGFFSAESTWSNTSRSYDPQLAGMYSWQSRDGRVGALAGVSYQKRNARSMEAGSWWSWWSNRDENGELIHPPVDVNGQPSPNGRQIAVWSGNGVWDQAGNNYSGYWSAAPWFRIRDEERERRGGQLTFQFKPVDELTLTTNYFRFELQGDYVSNQLNFPEWALYDDSWERGQGQFLLPGGLTFDPSGTIITGGRFQVPEAGCALPINPITGEERERICTSQMPQFTGQWSREETWSQTADFEAEWRGESFNASFKGGRTWSEGGPSMAFFMAAKPRRFGLENANHYSAWDITGTPSFEISPDIQDNLMAGIGEVDIGSTGSNWQQTRLEQRYSQMDFTHLFMSDWLDSIQYGIKYRDGRVHRNTGKTE